MDSFTYDAPRFFDFQQDLEQEDAKTAEAFFEVEHKTHFDVVNGTKMSIDEPVRELEQEFFTPLKLTPEISNAQKCLQNRLRKSMSMENLISHTNEDLHDDPVDAISSVLENLQMSADKSKKGIRSRNTNSAHKRKVHGMNTRADAPKLDLRSRSISRDQIHNLLHPKRKVLSEEDLSVKKFVSMAEAISQFHRKTPKRFHTKPKFEPNNVSKFHGPMPNTIPQSPLLATKQRARPVNILTREEREMKEYEEVNKIKIKANPVNTKMLNGPVQPKNQEVKKPLTKLEPFNLTQIPSKKVITPPKIPFEFHAKPIPKSVLEGPKPIIKPNLRIIPKTPKLMKRYAQDKPKTEVNLNNGVEKSEHKLVPTKPIPFSFDERDKDSMKKREQLLHELQEREKNARIFHARPLPKSIFRSPQPKSSVSVIYTKRQKSDNSLYKSTDSVPETTVFKARPAKVLQMKPFEPKKDDNHLIEISEFNLNTQRRAKERDEFEQKKKEKEEKLAQIIKEHQERLLQHELEEAATLRKQAEYKAQPIRKYKEVQPIAAKKLTDPVSPKFNYTKMNNKENSANITNV